MEITSHEKILMGATIGVLALITMFSKGKSGSASSASTPPNYVYVPTKETVNYYTAPLASVEPTPSPAIAANPASVSVVENPTPSPALVPAAVNPAPVSVVNNPTPSPVPVPAAVNQQTYLQGLVDHGTFGQQDWAVTEAQHEGLAVNINSDLNDKLYLFHQASNAKVSAGDRDWAKKELKRKYNL